MKNITYLDENGNSVKPEKAIYKLVSDEDETTMYFKTSKGWQFYSYTNLKRINLFKKEIDKTLN